MSKNPNSRMGTAAWGCLVAGVAAYDLLGRETMSSAYDRYLQHPVKKLVAIGAVAVTACHLLNIYEHFGLQDADPIDRIGRVTSWTGRLVTEVLEAINDQPEL